MSIYLNVPGVNGGSASASFIGDFVLADDSLGVFAPGAPPSEGGQVTFDPLVATLSMAATPGLSTLLADAANGTVLPSITLDVTDGQGNVIDAVTLTNATIVQEQEAGNQTALAFDYGAITIAPYHTNPDGTRVAGQAVTTSTAGDSFAAPPAPVLSEALTNSAETLYLNVSGDTGPSESVGFSGDFEPAGYAFSVGPGGTPGPLVVDLGADASAVGVSNLYADLVNGTVIPSVTLDLVVTAGRSTHTIEQVVLTNATVKDYTDPGGDVSVSFDYASATISTSTQRPDGSFSSPQTVSIGGTDDTAPVDAAVLPTTSANPLYLNVPGVDGGVTSTSFNKDFELTGYSLGGGAVGSDGRTVFDPLVATLSMAATPGLSTLLADAANGTVLPSITLDVTDAQGNIFDAVTLTNATIVQEQEAGNQTALAFDYGAITIAPYHTNPDGTRVAGQAVTTSTSGGSFAAAPAPVLSEALTNSAETLYLIVSGDTGPSESVGFIGDFRPAGYAFSVGTGGTPGPLVVDLGADGSALGVSNLYADLVNGTVIPSVTLDLVVTAGGSTTKTIEQVTLTNATVKDYTDPGGDVSVSFDYASATISTSTQRPDGSFSSPQTVSIGGTDDTAPVDAAVLPTTSANPLYLSVPGVDGGVTSTSFNKDFELKGYSLGGGAVGSDGRTIFDPLVATLSMAATPGLSTLLADAANGTVLPSITLDVTDGQGNVIDAVTLTNATIVQEQEAGNQTALAFDYGAITIAPYHTNPDGTRVAGQAVTTSTAGDSFAAPPAPVLSEALTNSAETLYLNVSGDTGPSESVGFSGDFELAGYAFSVGSSGTPGPLVADLGADGSAVGVSNLYADLVNGTVIPSVTLDLVVTAGASTHTIEQVVLTNATVKDYTDPGGDVSVSFDYASATISASTQRPDGSFSSPQTVSIGGTNGVACYCSGTSVLTNRGEVPIETLTSSDLLITASGAHRPVNWIGYRHLDLTKHPNPKSIWPVRVSAGAFKEGLPRRDLWLSPGHNVLAEGVLIPIRALVNGVTIKQMPVDHVTYWHVELDSHDLILAEGLPAESYLDTGNRTCFVNGGAFIEAYPDFEPRQKVDTCLPIRKAGTEVAMARASILVRAEELGYTTTTIHDLHVVADGRRVEPIELAFKRFAFVLPDCCKDVALVSRTFVPCHVIPESSDARVLGVLVTRLQIDGVEVSLETLPVSDWDRLEQRPKHLQRWTKGRASLPAGCRLVFLDLTSDGRYWSEHEDNTVAHGAEKVA